jgi:hypothetical protein
MTLRSLLAAAVIGVGTTALSAQDISTLLQRVPASANVVAFLDISGLIQSDLGSREGWSQKRTMDYYSGKVPFPPTSKFLVSAAEFNPVARRSNWQISLMNFEDKVDPYVVAKKEGSEVTWIEQLSVIPSRRNAYFVEFDRYNYGTYSPANRQQATRWVQFAKSNSKPTVSQYLVDNVQRGSGFGQFTTVMDLTNFLDKAEVLTRLRLSKTCTDNKVDVEALARVISGIKGLRLSVKATNALSAELQLDFSESAAAFESICPKLLDEVVNKLGLEISEIGGWSCRAAGTSVILRGGILPDEVRHLLALIVPIAPNVEVDQGSVTDAQATVTNTQRNFRAIDAMVKELRSKSDQFGRKRQWQASANWHEQTASRIDQLPNVNVDPDLMQYASSTAARIRIMAESLRGVNIQDKVLDSKVRYGSTDWSYGGGYNWGGYYGGGGWYDNRQDVETAKAEQAAAGAKERNQLWRMIGDDTTTIRKTLAEKYKVEF